MANFLRTVLHEGTDPVPVKAYFRKVFQVENPQATPTLWLRWLADDGAVVHLNGGVELKETWLAF